MKILMTGATGLIGTPLVKKLLSKSHDVTIISRNIQKTKDYFNQQVFVESSMDNLLNLNNFDAVINLAGEPIANKRWNTEQKEKIANSRWEITKKISSLINSSQNKPKVFISGSAIGYYGSQDDTKLNEESKPIDGFMHQVCKKWEVLAMEAKSESTRVCLLRTSIVLSSKGGALQKMITPFKYGLGAILGDGKQYMSWIHIDDMVEAICFLLENKNLDGAFNMSAPYPVTNKEFSKKLSFYLHRPCFMRVPAFALRLIMGEVSTILTQGQRVIPQKLINAGFVHKYPTLDDALKTIL